MDRIRMIENAAWEQDRRLEKVGHSHFVKVSYDQLPVDMQQRILAANTTNKSDHGTSRLYSRHGSAHSMSQMSSQQRQISSSLRKTTADTRPTSTRVNRSAKQKTERIDREDMQALSGTLRNKFDYPSSATQRNSGSQHEDDAATTTAASATNLNQHQQANSNHRLLQKHLNKLSGGHQQKQQYRHNISAFDSASMATICEQEDVEATLAPPTQNYLQG